MNVTYSYIGADDDEGDDAVESVYDINVGDDEEVRAITDHVLRRTHTISLWQ
jgi:hypothetical protein